jgi:16S rRNA (guanine527-N7)-methyltransferase
MRALAERYRLGEHERDRLVEMLRVLAEDEHAPSAVRDPAAAVEVHIADSLVAVDLPQVRGASQIADVGSGAGFPGLPVAVACPGSHVWLVESSARKCAFLRRAVRAVEIENVEVACVRVEDWAAGLGICDVVLARAVAPQPVVLEYAAPLLKRGGVLVEWRGALEPRDERASAAAAGELGLERVEVRPITTKARRAHPDHRRTGASRATGSPTGREQKATGGASGSGRYLYLHLKVRDTPERFPRRPGMARKRPLGLEPADLGGASDRAER